MANYPWGGGSGSGSSGSSGSGAFPWSGNSSSSSGSTATKTAPAPDPQKALLRLASRLQLIKGPNAKAAPQSAVIYGQIREALKGYSQKDIASLGQNAGLAPDAVQRLQSATPSTITGDIPAPLGAALSYLNRIPQAVLAGSAERKTGTGGLFNFGAALQGLEGNTNYSPIAANYQSVTGSTPKTAQKFEQSLPGLARFGGNLALGIAEDPTTYVSLGTTAEANAAVRSAAPEVAAMRGVASAQDIVNASKTGLVTASPGINDIAQQLATKGLSSLSKDEVKGLNPKLVKQLRGAPGGIKIAGRSIPGTNFLQTPEKVGANLVKGDTRIALSGAKAGIEQASKPTLEIVKATRTAYKEGKKSGLSVDQINAHVLKALDVKNTPQDWAALSQPEHDLATRIRGEYNKVTQEQRSAGILGPEVAGMVPADQYAARYLTPQSKDLQLASERAARQGSGRSIGLSPELMARDEKTQFTPQAELKNAAGAPTFEPNPALAAVRRIGEAKQDLAHTQAVEQLRSIRDTSGNPLLLAPDDGQAYKTADASGKYAIIKDAPVTVKAGKFRSVSTQDVLVPKEIHGEVSRTFDLLRDKSQQHAVVKAAEHATKLWKGYATVMGPLGSGFVIRNSIGNVINGFVLTGHLKNAPGDMLEAFNLQRKIHAGIKAGDWTSKLSSAEVKLINDAQSSRAIESGFFSHAADLSNSEDFAKSLGRGLKSGAPSDKSLAARVGGAITQGKASPLNPNNTMLRASRAVNSGVEDNARLALFLRLRKEGINPGSAGQVVNKYLFDYTHLDPLSEKYRQINPFFTWTRKNVPLQLDTLIKNPGKLTKQLHFIQAAQSVNPLNPRSVPNWASEGGAIGVGGGAALVPNTPLTSAADSTKFVADLGHILSTKLSTGSLPPGGVEGFFKDLFNAAGVGGPVGGTFSAVGQIAAGRNIFSGAPIKAGDYIATPSYLGGGWLPGAPKQIPKAVQIFAESVAPGLSKLRGVKPTSAADKAKFTTRLLSILGGQTVTPVGKSVVGSNAYASQEQLAALVNWLKSQKVSVPPGQYATKKKGF